MAITSQIEVLFSELLRKRGIPPNLDEQLQDYPALRQLAEEFILAREATHAIAKGNLSQSLELKGYWVGALKALQSNLRHLTWQTSMVASGDFSQRIDFMGDFSAAFNKMIGQLQQAEANEKAYMAELQQRELEIKESEQRYRLIAENIADVVLLLDNDLNVIYSSPSIARLLGYSPEEFTNSSLAERVPAIAAELRKAVAKACGNRLFSPVLIEVEQQHQDGKMIWMESLIRMANDENNAHIGFHCVIRNITDRKLAERHIHKSYERRLRNEFFNKLLNGQIKPDSEAYAHAHRLGIKLPSLISLYFLSVEDNSLTDEVDMLKARQKNIDTIIDQLTLEAGTVAWETPEGIGIISTIHNFAERKNKELETAQAYTNLVSAAFPAMNIRIGIADYFEGLTNFDLRFQHAQSAVRIGKGIWPDQAVYHFENCGIYQVLIPFADTGEAEVFVERVLGPLLEYERKNNKAELVDTLEKLLSGLNLKEIAEQTFFHYKTIQSRKQRIEEILQVNLDSAEVRMMLGTAMHLLKIPRSKNRVM